MYNKVFVLEKLENILKSLQHIPRRFASIEEPADFRKDNDGIDSLDGICMSLIAVGEAFKRIDDKTNGELLKNYPEIEWRGVIGVRNVIAHGYFDVDVEQVFDICEHDIPELISVVEKIIVDLS
mgnify:CR=1 FL=1